jgi:hypothetical protein
MKVIRYKKWAFPCLLMLVVGLAASRAFADDFTQLQKPRVFTTADGKEVTLKVLDWNPQRKKLHVENDKGKKVWISPRTFKDADQSYLKEWISAHGFLSNNKLYVSAKREDRGGYVSYNISVHNKTAVDYEKVTVKYEVERVWDNYDTGEEENKNKPGKIFVGTIKAGSRKTFKTQPVKASETYIMIPTPKPVLVRSGVSFTYTNEVPQKTGKERVNGIRLKFQGPRLENERIIREVYINK